jgi:hypothetical protein
LHNGELYFTTQSDGENVNITFGYRNPDKLRGTTETNISLTINEYLFWWRSMAYGIYNLANSL